MRFHYIDNIRWVTIFLVLFFHVFYYYNTYCTGTGIGGFSNYQPQDAVLYLLYPWMMVLLFTVAGMCSHYALKKYTYKEYLRVRTRKLLVPTTLGLFVFQWIAGYFGMQTMNYRIGSDMTAGQPIWIVFPILIISGSGGLWFIQLLWCFSLITPLLDKITKTLHKRKPPLMQSIQQRYKNILIDSLLVVSGLLLWLADQSVMDTTNMQDIRALYNLYRPLYYLTAYLLGYYLFYQTTVQERITHLRWFIIPMATACGIWLTIHTFGEDAYSPAYIRSIGNNLYAWLMILAMLSGFRMWANHTNRTVTYFAHASYGMYILQFAVYLGTGYMLRAYTNLPPWSLYILLLLAVFIITPILNELLKRIPVIRYCVLGYLPHASSTRQPVSPLPSKCKTLLLPVLLCLLPCNMAAQDTQQCKKVFQGYSGGMMLHAGWLGGTQASHPYNPQGATIGIGGALRVNLWNHLRVGGEGDVSTMPSNLTTANNILQKGSYLRNGRGGVLVDACWRMEKIWPYIGMGMGGGAKRSLFIIDGSQDDWEKEPNTIFNKQTYFYVSPFAGFDYALTKAVHISFKLDCIVCIHKGNLLSPIGPRLYFGFMFCH